MAQEITAILPDDTTSHVAAAALSCGEIVVEGHKVGVVQTLEGVATGEKCEIRIRGRAFLPAASGTTFTAGANVQFNTTTRLAVASGGTHAGRAEKAKTSGQLGVWVYLNEPATA